jgi:iron complex outermembrane receptor protein
MRELSAKTIASIASLGAVSYFVVSVDSSGVIQAARAQQPSLPPVTIVAPKPKVRQTAKRSRTRTASPVQRRVAEPAPRQAAPVPYVVPSTGTVGTVPPVYAGGHKQDRKHCT